MNIGGRLFRILKSLASDDDLEIKRHLKKGEAFLEGKIREWEKQLGIRDNDDEKRAYQRKARPKSDQSPYSGQLVEDLKMFGLTPPSNWTEVKEARKREMKKFHPDKFANDPKNIETAQQITQIYNAAFERLKKEFNG